MATLYFLLDTLKQAGHRITPQRKAICQALAESKEHPSAQQIYEQLRREDDTLSLATVYNTLDALVNAGAINILGDAGDDALHYDADTEPHVNLACISCHRIVDIPSRYVHHLDEEIEQTSGYRLLGSRVLYYGLCPNCQKKEVSKGSAAAQ
ncbi:MAG: transcriptional repressor [Anaerolineae bacterium]|nr:transcriptional repressor [Anaerolineae bacterium]